MGRWTKTLASTQSYSFMSKGRGASEMRRNGGFWNGANSSLLACIPLSWQRRLGQELVGKGNVSLHLARCISVPKLLLPLQLMLIKREYLDSTSQRRGGHRKSEGYNCPHPPGKRHAFQTASVAMAFQQPIWLKSSSVPHHSWSESTQNANAASSPQRKETQHFFYFLVTSRSVRHLSPMPFVIRLLPITPTLHLSYHFRFP